jgi:FtsP/CotA-like multicopper oxidase with cupredoxin domain
MELFNDHRKQIVREFDIEVISIPIVYNKYGDHDPNGLLYVLKKDASRIKTKAMENFEKEIPQPYEEVRPLVLRANVGDEIVVNLYNSLNRNVSMHVQGLSYDVKTSDGAFVGMNPDTTTSKQITYKWQADNEGVYLFSDMADTRSSEEGTNVHGLFGAIIIEKPGSTWLDPITGEPLESGLFADIYNPKEKSFREYAVFFHDELEIKNKDGKVPIDPHTGLPAGTTGISYRAEPMRNRDASTIPPVAEIAEMPHEHPVIGEDISMSSWPYGDPAPEILRAYVGDPAKIRLIHGGIKETHVFHLHNHQWRLEPDNLNSTIIDSQSISPQECYTFDILYGAGSLNGMIGDAIWHCHLYPHFHEGMWSLWRVFDRLEDGTGKYPDKTPVKALLPLKDRPIPPKKDKDHPGFYNFINGTSGTRPKQPPLGILTPEGKNKINPTDLERANFVEGFVPGALYTKSCPCIKNCKLKVFEIALVQAKVIYNSYGWNDPQGRFFVLKEELKKHGGLDEYVNKVEKGLIKAEPLVIRANAGDCIEIRLTNLLPEILEGSAFQLETLTGIAGYHIHLVKFDTIVSDGGSNGWNNIAGARQYETLIERFYANEELHTVFFHDHLYANSHQQHGVFGALIVEPEGSTFHDIHTGEKIQSGTKAVIRKADGYAFREFALFVHDFALLFDKAGKPLNPPPVPGSDQEPGVMGINYRSEPMRERLGKKDDPAYIFSSSVHKDPATPILETYPGDDMMIRLIDGAHEEQHAFNIVGMSWKRELDDKLSPLSSSQTIGISEAFNLRIDEPYGSGDYLYYFGGIDDAWLGLWGIIRAYDKQKESLLPLGKGKEHIAPPMKPGKGAVIRRYEIAAIQKDIKYNKYGDHDPDGLLFVPLKEMKHVLSGKKQPKPLILRANAGDWIEVTLHNKLNAPVPYYDYPIVPLDKEHQPSNRVSINPQFLKYDNIKYSGVNVGNNKEDQTVGPGEMKKYLWYADKEYGTCGLQSFGDLRNHRYHGLFGAIIIEPPAAKWYKHKLLVNGDYEEQVVITAPKVKCYKEFMVFIQNGIRMLDSDGKLIKTAGNAVMEPGPGHEEPGAHDSVDPEDTGEKGYNYRSERFHNRLKKNKKISKIFSSKIHGDPATPLFNAHSGERVIFRTLMLADKPRNVGFGIHGHVWKEQQKDPKSRLIPLQGAISIGSVYNMELKDGASYPGDYLYRSGTLKWDVESGMWGIFRVKKSSIKCKCKNLYEKLINNYKK